MNRTFKNVYGMHRSSYFEIQMHGELELKYNWIISLPLAAGEN